MDHWVGKLGWVNLFLILTDYLMVMEAKANLWALEALNSTTVYADGDQCQTGKYSYRDGMRNARKTVEQAMEMADKFVRAQFIKAETLHKEGKVLPDLQHTFYRMYDAALGRFLGVDPEAEASDVIGTYHYALANLVMFNDPLGDKGKIFNEISVYDIINTIYMNDKGYGGRWPSTSPEQVQIYENPFEAFGVVTDRIDLLNAWDTTLAGGFDAAFYNVMVGAQAVTKKTSLVLRSVTISEARLNIDLTPSRVREAINLTKLDRSTFYGINVYASNALEPGQAITFPGVGIVVNRGDLSDVDLLRHEFDHILQAQKIGKFGNSGFYGKIGIPSITNTIIQRNKKRHHNHKDTWNESLANDLSYEYLGRPSDWNFTRLPTSPPDHYSHNKYPSMRPTEFYEKFY